MSGSSNSSKSAVDSSMFSKRRRAYMACTNCRQRKIKCITSSDGDFRPCTRCAKRNLQCEYVAVPEEFGYGYQTDSASSGSTNASGQYLAAAGASWAPQAITPPSAGLNNYMQPSAGGPSSQRASGAPVQPYTSSRGDYSTQLRAPQQGSGLPAAGYPYAGNYYTGYGSTHQQQYSQQQMYAAGGPTQPV
ncbi:unnamed protein product [Mycena citricolor]|uniref:Zn(2)-C6 fungal-type domain-containing protein n=1 Tax=Mycena citricolor TaxID=2018698 RepID=A0AAD2HVQ3_9AGAR|nr:unnamed protein product [Mycena citricolor]